MNKLSKSNPNNFLQDLELFYNLPDEEKKIMTVIFMKYFCLFPVNEDVFNRQYQTYLPNNISVILGELRRWQKEFKIDLGLTSKSIINKKTASNLELLKNSYGGYAVKFCGYLIGFVSNYLPNVQDIDKFLRSSLIDGNDHLKAYIGFDCTKPFLHYGHLKTLLNAIQDLKEKGFTKDLIILFGTTTALIGDPTGQDFKRPMLTSKKVFKNKIALQIQIEIFMTFLAPDINFYFLDNDYLSFIDFKDLKEVFSLYTVNKLIEANRMKKDGLTVSELIYPLLQAYDFYYLYCKFRCVLQYGGKDQEINMLYGKHLINITHPNSILRTCTVTFDLI